MSETFLGSIFGQVSLENSFMKNMYLVEQCRSLVPLGAMRNDHLLAALDKAEAKTVCTGDTLFAEAESKHALFYLLSGEVLLKHQSGKERIITADFHWLPIVQFQAEDFSAIALTDCELLRFDREHLDNLLTWSQVADYIEVDISYDRNLDEDADWLRSMLNSNLFYKIPPLNVLSIYEKVSSRSVHKGEVIVEQGQEGDYCYFIKEGSAEVLRQSTLDDEKQLVARIGEGRCFGEDALITATSRNATVRMLTDGVLMCLHRSDFSDLLEPPCVENIAVDSIDSMTASDTNAFTYLDVRSQEEFDYKHIIDAIHIPFTLLRLKIRLLDPQKQYLVYCNSGTRSAAAAYLLQQKGYKVSVLDGGLANLTDKQVNTLLMSEFDTIYQMANNAG